MGKLHEKTSDYSYTFDDIGNRVEATSPSLTSSYEANALNQYSSVSSVSSVVSFDFDDDGNLTDDGTWIYTWNGENRLVQMVTTEGTEDSEKKKLVFAYDYMGRRISKEVYEWDATKSLWSKVKSLSFVYDGWNLISETAHSTSSGQTSTNVYVWGLDLAEQSSGLARHSSPGAKAGGVGGLLSQTTIDATTTNSYFATADANGNISDYVDEAGNVAAHFEFDAFGRVTTESIAQSLEPDAFPFRFSSKYEDIETGLNYYGFRYYNAEQGRWLNRDPIGEGGGLNIYANCLNQCINKIDWLGLADCPCTSAQMLAAGQAYISCLDGKITEYNNCLSSCYTHGKIIGGFYNFHNGVMRQHNFPGSLPDPGLELQKAIKECIASSCAPILANAASDCEKDCHDY